MKRTCYPGSIKHSRQKTTRKGYDVAATLKEQKIHQNSGQMQMSRIFWATCKISECDQSVVSPALISDDARAVMIAGPGEGGMTRMMDIGVRGNCNIAPGLTRPV